MVRLSHHSTHPYCFPLPFFVYCRSASNMRCGIWGDIDPYSHSPLPHRSRNGEMRSTTSRWLPNNHPRFSGLGGQWGASSSCDLQEVLAFLIGRVSASLPGFAITLSGPPFTLCTFSNKRMRVNETFLGLHAFTRDRRVRNVRRVFP